MEPANRNSSFNSKKYRIVQVMSTSTFVIAGQSRQNSIPAVWFFSLFFLINPFFSVFFLFFFLLISKKVDAASIYFLCFLLAVYIGCINSTKLPVNDLVWYMDFFSDAGKMKLGEYISSLGGTGKEPAFSIFNFIAYRLVFGSGQLYLVLFGAITYTLLCTAVYRFSVALHSSKRVVLFAILVMALLPYIFTLSAHLLRQFLATSILFFVMVERFFYNKKYWWLLGIMIFIHSSSLLFLPFVIVPFLGSPVSKKTIGYYFILLAVIFFIQKIAGSLLLLAPFGSSLSYAFVRASQNTGYELEPLSLVKIATAILLAIVPQFIIYFRQRELKKNRGAVHFFNILFFLMCFIILNLNQVELSNRFNFYGWFFCPFILVIVLNHVKPAFVFYPVISVFLFFFFIYYLHAGTWEYKISSSILTSTLFHYFF
jgi:hypothetical protein